MAIDIDADRLALARKMRADHLINGSAEDEIEVVHTITHTTNADDAPALYERINRGEPVIGAVIHWSD